MHRRNKEGRVRLDDAPIKSFGKYKISIQTVSWFDPNTALCFNPISYGRLREPSAFESLKSIFMLLDSGDGAFDELMCTGFQSTLNTWAVHT